MAILSHEKFLLKSYSPGGNTLEVEMNYRGKKDFVYDEVQGEEVPLPDDKKVIKFKVNGQEAEVNFADLWAIVFMYSGGANQTKLAPVSWSTQRLISQYIKIKAKKDIKKGEEMIVKHTVKVPEKYIQQVNTSSGIIIDKQGLDLIGGNI